MPNLGDLLKEIGKLGVDADDVRVSADIYDHLVNQAEQIVDENEED